MIDKIEQWIDQTLADFYDRKISCEQFLLHFTGFYPAQFLSKSYFVVIDEIPKPNFPELYTAGLENFMNIDSEGITYKNTYFVKTEYQNCLDLHFHELVHVLQWKYLGAEGFISRYIEEIQKYGYLNAPLEKMAYTLDEHFSNKGKVFNIPDYVRQQI